MNCVPVTTSPVRFSVMLVLATVMVMLAPLVPDTSLGMEALR